MQNLYKIPGKTVITAHRGMSGLYPENTMMAFEKAVEFGVDIVEFDVRLSGDGVPVILHDAALDRTTDGSGPVSSFSISELRKLNASFWKGPHNTGCRKDFGVDYIQPTRNLVNKNFCEQINRLGLCANMFFANSADEAGEYIKMGMKGIMTDNPHLMPNEKR
ncbi:MAG: hypothetical protein A2017_10480 [Lentisphaerae bacterium GWF2_44_16]|nr:MAG: hypothetical protein A2017_10480 [Lentisphaerae bacterium GWF2_44_16]